MQHFKGKNGRNTKENPCGVHRATTWELYCRNLVGDTAKNAYELIRRLHPEAAKPHAQLKRFKPQLMPAPSANKVRDTKIGRRLLAWSRHDMAIPKIIRVRRPIEHTKYASDTFNSDLSLFIATLDPLQ